MSKVRLEIMNRPCRLGLFLCVRRELRRGFGLGAAVGASWLKEVLGRLVARSLGDADGFDVVGARPGFGGFDGEGDLAFAVGDGGYWNR